MCYVPRDWPWNVHPYTRLEDAPSWGEASAIATRELVSVYQGGHEWPFWLHEKAEPLPRALAVPRWYRDPLMRVAGEEQGGRLYAGFADALMRDRGLDPEQYREMMTPLTDEEKARRREASEADKLAWLQEITRAR